MISHCQILSYLRSLIHLARKKGRQKFRRGHAPYLTKIRFYWCDTCNVPRIAETACSKCGTIAREVKLSPPGDPYPAMEGHVAKIGGAIDNQYGAGVGTHVLPHNKVVIINKVPSLDAMFEVIVDGHLIGRLRFEIRDQGYNFMPSLEGGRRIGEVSKEKWVSCHDGVLKYLKDGANLLVPGVLGCDSGIVEGDEVWVIDSNGSVIAVGTARMSGEDMAKSEKGHAVKIREVADPNPSRTSPHSADWDLAVRANESDLIEIEKEATSFIHRTIERNEGVPVVVGFSGGKDSLATYLVVDKVVDPSPPLFFLNTGLELPETLQYVNDFARAKGVKVIGDDAGDQFWDSVDAFGPPARDFRWCCKVLKLGPAATSISDELGGQSLSFMGQRKLESFTRSIESRVSSNPWVPGQISANPIQNWNALEVWLYIFKEKAPFNELYNRGYHRMGCYLCPASPLAELESLRETHPELHERWITKLEEWAQKLGYPPEWITCGFWRWKNLPPGQMKLVDEMGLEISAERPAPTERMKLEIVKGVSPCTSAGFSLEGQFSGGVDLERIGSVLRIFGPTRISEELGALRVNAGDCSISVFSSGSIVIRGEDERRIERLASKIERAVTRAMFCQACGSCIPQCEQDALELKDGKVTVDEKKCTNCLKCDSWPCPTYLS
ncbi:MAG: phosphoadenosine phosphosulfate reductase family protein [Candidatus Thorarchaeota archaeon]